MDLLQKDLDQNESLLDIQILGMNPIGHEIGNSAVTEGRDIPWLQDTDEDGDGQWDNWLTSWPFVYRDVVIVDANNVAVDAYNLTLHSLEESENYDTLRQMLIDVAQSTINPRDDVVVSEVGASIDVAVLANDEGTSRLVIDSVSQPTSGNAKIVTIEHPADLDPIDANMSGLLVISEVVPGEYIEIFNTAYSEVELSRTSKYLVSGQNRYDVAELADAQLTWSEYVELFSNAVVELSGVGQVLVSGAHVYDLSELSNGQKIESRGYAQLLWPDGLPVDEEAGEIILFRDNLTGFEDSTKIHDFIVWGPTQPDSRIELARRGGKWTGPPDGPLDMGAIQRIPGTVGADAHAYDNHRPATPGMAINRAVKSQQFIRYTPDSDFSGSAKFAYTVVDDQGTTDSAVVNVFVRENARSWQNPTNPLDVNNDDMVNAADVSAIIDRLNVGFVGVLPKTVSAPLVPPPFVDCDGSNSVEPLDALLIINHLNAIEVAAEGEP